MRVVVQGERGVGSDDKIQGMIFQIIAGKRYVLSDINRVKCRKKLLCSVANL